MNKLFKKIKEKLMRKTFWIQASQARKIEIEAKKNWGDNQSALMRAIINNWFEK